jgi:hypothetical protein
VNRFLKIGSIFAMASALGSAVYVQTIPRAHRSASSPTILTPGFSEVAYGQGVWECIASCWDERDTCTKSAASCEKEYRICVRSCEN